MRFVRETMAGLLVGLGAKSEQQAIRFNMRGEGDVEILLPVIIYFEPGCIHEKHPRILGCPEIDMDSRNTRGSSRH